MNETSATPGSGAKPLSETKRRLLQQYMRGDFGQSRDNDDIVTRHTSHGFAPLSLAQEQVWLQEMAAPGAPPFYNESITMHRHGPLDRIALSRCLNEVVRRHEIWRTSYKVIEGQMVQVVHPAPSEVSIRFVDLRQLPRGERETETLRVADHDASLPFDLERVPLLRFTLVTLDDEQHRLFMTIHQSVVDGVSVYQVFPLELTTLYEAFSNGKPSPLPELSVQYSDFAYWERTRHQAGGLYGQLAYWRKQLAGKVETLQWPSTRPPLQTFRGAIHSFEVSAHLTRALKRLSQQEGVTLFMTLTAGFAALLHRYTGQGSIVIGTLGPAGRKRPEVQRLLGYFLNPLALRIEVSRDTAFRELLRHVRELVVEALANDDQPFQYVVSEVGLKPDPSRHPLFQVAISLAPSLPELAPGWTQTVMDVQSGGSKWDLYLEFSERADGLMGRAQYNPDIFEAATINQTLGELQSLLGEAVLRSDEPLQQLLESRRDADRSAVPNMSIA